MSLNARDIAFQLSERGIPVLSITEPTEKMDGIIEITPRLQVQVSVLDDFMNVVTLTEDGMLDFGEVSESLEDIVGDLHNELSQATTTVPG